ncbi:XTP/dITP diphosphohydrolase [Clostridium cavendishii DSM 21758]|uniref:dITP/XTP pyrophosphatase n=1 Tax=Clostridium cavendishii DSM 21758 TaxID=1121302 RepID=A0A1M6LF03_9CLOT|nr:XTP/dITP diphosphatase [Clostridium cavendishii]SHJ69728.1 XTP/dITP diphosphohydrolase [Clostridium cavendishii DSM 21758]
MKKVIVASNNEHKVKEIKEILNNLNVEIVSLKDAGIFIDVEEDGKTFEENAYKKAKVITEYLLENGESNFIVMSDDSGLEVECLNGEPGVYSARYAGEHGNSEKNNEKLLNNLRGVEKEQRGASFVCSIVLITDNLEEIKVEGRTHGEITETYSGSSGFGYDPIFFVKDFNKTFAQMTSKEKNLISHRGKALNKIRAALENFLK